MPKPERDPMKFEANCKRSKIFDSQAQIQENDSNSALDNNPTLDSDSKPLAKATTQRQSINNEVIQQKTGPQHSHRAVRPQRINADDPRTTIKAVGKEECAVAQPVHIKHSFLYALSQTPSPSM